MRAANVISTVNLLQLCAAHHGKMFAFVSSTATVEAESYVKMSDDIVARGGRGVPETDDLEGSRTGLTTGYGQSKWVAEKVIFEAAKRGLTGRTVRPSYIVGDSKTAGEGGAEGRGIPEIILMSRVLSSHEHRRLPMASRQGLSPARSYARHQQYDQHGPSGPRRALIVAFWHLPCLVGQGLPGHPSDCAPQDQVQ
jgi:hypothetical protein